MSRYATIKDMVRMCKNYYKKDCNGCPFDIESYAYETSCTSFFCEHLDEANDLVLKWCDEHPPKTRQSEFLKQYPNVRFDKFIQIRPCELDIQLTKNEKCKSIRNCDECIEKYWNEVIE